MQHTPLSAEEAPYNPSKPLSDTLTDWIQFDMFKCIPHQHLHHSAILQEKLLKRTKNTKNLFM
jgi:hypothetical protein